jgi:thioredoxin-like negative regulator of GroEL
MTTPHLSLRTAAVLLAMALATDAARAQSIRWRTDYNAARREAIESDRPILIDFGTENCFYCKKLDASTFRDPGVVSTLNERFIPLKIDAEREPALAQALRVQVYPTLLLAAPDGKILGVIEGYLEAGRLNDHLVRAVQTAATPDWMARDMQEATKSMAGGEYARAVTLLKGIGQDGKTRPVQVKARQMLGELEQQAAGRLARARQMQDNGQSLEAIDTLTSLMKSYAGTQAADDASLALAKLSEKPEARDQQKVRRARDLLAQAREDFRGKQYLNCLDRCEVIAASYGGTPEAAEAGQLASEIKANPEWLARACDDLHERLGSMYLALADSHAKKGDTAQAKACLEKVVKTCPNSSRAETAQVRLAKLNGRDTQQAEFSKP